jgi:ABC-type lipoprotein release transport system permease subunit
MFNDLRYAVRMLLKSPALSALLILSLSLGIAACLLPARWAVQINPMSALRSE